LVRTTLVTSTYQNSRVFINADGDVSENPKEVRKNMIPLANALGNQEYSSAVLLIDLYYS